MRVSFVLVFLFAIGFKLHAQEIKIPEEEEDSVTVATPEVQIVAPGIQEDTTVLPIRPIIPSIYIDYGKLLTIPLDIETKYEVGIEILLKEKIPLIVEVGKATLNPTKVYANGSYEAEGTYYRIGTGIYSQFVPKNKLGMTFRYAVSSFDETAVLDTENTINIPRTLTASYQRTDISASWLEVALYSDRKINNLLSIGLNLRWRYLLDHDRQAPDDVYAIPGYGRSFDSSIPAANLFLKISF